MSKELKDEELEMVTGGSDLLYRGERTERTNLLSKDVDRPKDNALLYDKNVSGTSGKSRTTKIYSC